MVADVAATDVGSLGAGTVANEGIAESMLLSADAADGAPAAEKLVTVTGLLSLEGAALRLRSDFALSGTEQAQDVATGLLSPSGVPVRVYADPDTTKRCSPQRR